MNRSEVASWELDNLEDLLQPGTLTYGIVQPGAHDPTGVPIVRVKDLEGGRIDTSEPLRVSAAIEERYARSRIRSGDVLLSLVGSVGTCAIAPASVESWNLARAVALLRPKPDVDPRWLSYVLRSRPAQTYIGSVVNTTVQTTLNLRDLRQLPVPMPSAAERNAIVGVVGALDDKIESNRRIYSGVAELLRAEADIWRASVTGWQSTTFGEFADVYGGSTPRTTEPAYWDGPLQWATPSDITALDAPYLFRTKRSITEAGLASCSAELHPLGTIFMTSRATIGAFAIPQVPCATNQGFIVVRPRASNHRWFLLDEMQRRVSDFLDRANGSTFLEISRGNFKSMNLNVPADSTALAALHDALDSLHERAARAFAESATLAELRDMLLPELLSGRLTAETAHELVESGSR